MELLLLAVNQSAVIKRITADKFSIRFQREMNAKEKRQQDYDHWWMRHTYDNIPF